MGVWIDELKREFESRGLPFPRATGIAMDAADFNMEASMREIAGFLTNVEPRRDS
jgi:hypothetical protein